MTVTLKDIARECGVSVSTVSRALNGVALITPSLAREIRETAQKMGYAPNAVARTLKTNRSMMIGVLFEVQLNHPYFSLLIEALRASAEKRGFDMLLLSRISRNGRLDYTENALSRRMDGVVILYANPDADGLRRLLSGNIPVVAIDNCDRECDIVSSDYRDGTAALVSAAAACGHRRIAFLHGEMGFATRERIRGYHEAMAAHGLQEHPGFLRQASFNDGPLCAEITQSLLQLPDAPTCVLMPDDFSALTALQLLRERGICAPRDFSCLGYDGIGWGQRISPRLTTYRQDTAAIGEAAVTRLIAALDEGAGHQISEITVHGALIGGETMGQAAAQLSALG